ncbi:MAG: hypothetical protein HZA91_08980, partial [Verrucomicrobia bacterium]|nr:hypothetical protein [Verrucomicrobiota bacterium]
MWCSCAALWWSALAIAAAIEPAATVTLTVEAARPGRCELAISEDALIERLSAILPDPITRDDFNHADVALKLGDKIVGGYELVVADENLVKDGRFELPMEKSPWNGLRRREYSLKPEPGQPGKVFWIESDKIQNTRLSQRVQLKKDRLYLLSYAGYSDVQAYDFAVQLVDPARKYNAQLPHSHKRPLHHQQRWARYQHLVRADIEAPELWIGTALKGRAGVTDIQLHPARWRLVADAPRAGAQQFTLAYVPRMGRHMTPPTSEPKPDSTLPPAKVTLGKVEMVAPNPDGVLVKTPSGEAWTLPGDWPLRIDRLRDSRPPAPAARHEVTVARGVDATILLALDLKSSGFKLDSLRCDLPVKVLALRLASVPVNRFGNMDEVVYRQLDPMVEVNDPLVPFDPGVPTVLALTIQCAETTPAGTHDGEIELKLLTGSGDIPVAAS